MEEQAGAMPSGRWPLGTGAPSDVYAVGSLFHWIVTGTAPDLCNDLGDQGDVYPWAVREGLKLTPFEESLVGDIFSHTLVESPFRRIGMGELKERFEDLCEVSKSFRPIRSQAR